MTDGANRPPEFLSEAPANEPILLRSDVPVTYSGEGSEYVGSGDVTLRMLPSPAVEITGKIRGILPLFYAFEDKDLFVHLPELKLRGKVRVTSQSLVFDPQEESKIRVLEIEVAAKVDAWRLSQWYLELFFLYLFDYRGTYRNRLSARHIGELEPVPWAAAHS